MPLLPLPGAEKARAVIVGEGVTAASFAAALTDAGTPCRAVSAVDTDRSLSAGGIPCAVDEDDILPLLEGAEIMIADPLYRPICPAGIRFVPLPHEGFSGRLFRRDIPCLVTDFDSFRKEFRL